MAVRTIQVFSEHQRTLQPSTGTLGSLSQEWFEVPAIYMFGKLCQGILRVSYIGETSNLQERMKAYRSPQNERDKRKAEAGDSVFAFKSDAVRALRVKRLDQLIEHFRPPLNEFANPDAKG